MSESTKNLDICYDVVLDLDLICDANGNGEINETDAEDDGDVLSEIDSDLDLITCQNCGGTSCWWSGYDEKISQETESEQYKNPSLTPHHIRSNEYMHFTKLRLCFTTRIVPECVTKSIGEL